MPESANNKVGNDTTQGNAVEQNREDYQKTDRIEVGNVLAEMEQALNDIVNENPRVSDKTENSTVRLDDLRAVLEISLAINSTLVLDEILKLVMLNAVNLLSAERGFLMLLDEHGQLQFTTAHNIKPDETRQERFRISQSIANRTAKSGRSVYTSDAQNDERYSDQQSIVELKLRSIMCVPLKIKSKVIGVIYLDNSSQAKLFLRSDLFLFELFAQQAAMAIYNAQLYDNQQRLKKYNEDIIAQSPVGIIVIDSNYNLVTINDASLAIFQVNKCDIKLADNGTPGSRFLDLIPDATYNRWQKMIEAVLASGHDFKDDRYFHDTGFEEKVLSIKISSINSLPGNRNGVILVIEDITEKIILEKYVILSEKLVAKGEMAASIGHELNNYLGIISNNAELIQVNLQRNQFDKALKNSHQVIDHIGRMKRFTDGLMDFSKMETEMVLFDIKTLVENLLFSIKSHKRYKNIKLDPTFSSDLPEAFIDVGQIQQVLLNLLNNAADAMEDTENPHITLDCRYDKALDQFVINVTDNGSGMGEEVSSRIFENHFTTKKVGHGIGLANTRKIIHNHGGEISVQSEENKGTTFTVTLPRQPKSR